MIFEIIIYALLLAMMLLFHQRNLAIKYYVPMLLCNMLCMVACVCYLAKDVYYYDTIDHYFWISRSVWRQLVFLPLDRQLLIRVMNWSAAGFYCFGLLFAEAFTGRPPFKGTLRRFGWAWLIWFALQGLVYDPTVYRAVYSLCYPALMSAHTFHQLEDILHAVTWSLDLALIVAGSAAVMLFACRRTTLRVLRVQAVAVGVGYCVLMTLNTPIILGLPQELMRVSKVAGGFITFNRLPLGRVEWVYSVSSLINVLAFVLIAICILMRIGLTRRMNHNQLQLSQRIDAANTTSKAFCHYMKNEVLSLEAELDELTLPDAENARTVASIRARCDRLYQRLEEVHRSTKQDMLHLLPLHILTPVHGAVDALSAELNGFTVHFPDENPKVMLDSEYFRLCIEDLLRNAVEATAGLPEARKTIEISVTREQEFIRLELRDHGCGLSPKIRKDLFTPFCSTKPIKSNWGIGLSLVYRIMRAHGGRVTLENALPDGVRVCLLLPALDSAQ